MKQLRDTHAQRGNSHALYLSLSLSLSISLSHTHTHTHVGFYGLRGLSIGVMVFILYKLFHDFTLTSTSTINVMRIWRVW